MDFYERAYFNGVSSITKHVCFIIFEYSNILGNQNVEAGPGVMLYNYPLGTGFNKVCLGLQN
jgi:hypothetical protein